MSTTTSNVLKTNFDKFNHSIVNFDVNNNLDQYNIVTNTVLTHDDNINNNVVFNIVEAKMNDKNYTIQDNMLIFKHDFECKEIRKFYSLYLFANKTIIYKPNLLIYFIPTLFIASDEFLYSIKKIMKNIAEYNGKIDKYLLKLKALTHIKQHLIQTMSFSCKFYLFIPLCCIAFIIVFFAIIFMKLYNLIILLTLLV